MKRTPPRYLINPLATGAVLWTPESHQIIVGYQNPSYINSVWLGTLYSVLTFPERVFWLVLVPLFNFKFKDTLFGLLALFAGSLLMLVYCLFGRIRGIPVAREVANSGLLMPKAYCRAALGEGNRDLVTDLDLLNAPEVFGTATSLDK